MKQLIHWTFGVLRPDSVGVVPGKYFPERQLTLDQARSLIGNLLIEQQIGFLVYGTVQLGCAPLPVGE